MDKSTRYNKLFDDLETKKQHIGEGAAAFPTKEEYLAKDTQERLDTANEILTKYAHVSRNNWSGTRAKAQVEPKDRPGTSLLTNVAHLSERIYEERSDVSYRGRNSYRVTGRVPEAIEVHVWAYDAENDMASPRPLNLGELRNGSYRDSEGEAQEGWYVFMGTNRRNTEGNTLTLDSQHGQEMLEFVDAAVVGLIDGVISDQRKFLGVQAVIGQAAEAVASS